MKPGSVIVDMASEQGGNCELTEPGKVVVKHGVIIIGYTDLPSRLPTQASNSVLHQSVPSVRRAMQGQGRPCSTSTWSDEVIRGTTVVKEGLVTWPPPAPSRPPPPRGSPAAKPAAKARRRAEKKGHGAGAEPMSATATVGHFRCRGGRCSR